MPTVDHVGISRRIGTDKERQRLRGIVESMRPKGAGFIVRTVAEGVTEQELQRRHRVPHQAVERDPRQAEAGQRRRRCSTPTSICCCAPCATCSRREVDKLIVDNKARVRAPAEVRRRVHAATSPARSSSTTGASRSSTATASRARSIARSSARCGCASGGSLIIDQGEALTAIDVNTGNFVGKKSGGLEETITKTNLEACKEVARSAAAAQHRRHHHRRLHRHGQRAATASKVCARSRRRSRPTRPRPTSPRSPSSASSR